MIKVIYDFQDSDSEDTTLLADPDFLKRGGK
jgi:hypothetical protein